MPTFSFATTESYNKIRQNKYIECLYRYGFITLCYLMWQYEQEENYEECAIIKGAIDYHNLHLKDNLPTTFDNKSFDQFDTVVATYDLSGKIIKNNIPAYASKVILHVGHSIRIDVNKTMFGG